MTTTTPDAELRMLRGRVAALEAAQAAASADNARFEGLKQLSEAVEQKRLAPFMFWHSYPAKWRRLIIWPQLVIWAGIAATLIGAAVIGLVPDPEEAERQAFYRTLDEVNRDIADRPGLMPMQEVTEMRRHEMERRMAERGFPEYKYGK